MKTDVKLSSNVNCAPRCLHHLGRTRRHQNHEDRRRQDRGAGRHGRVPQHVLHELLAEEHRAHQRAENDDARDRCYPEGGPCRDLEIIERIRARRCRMTKRTKATTTTTARPSTRVRMAGTAAKLMARISDPTSTIDRMPPKLSTGSVPTYGRAPGCF